MSRELEMQSFWMGGFESSSHITTRGQRLDMIAATAHEEQADGDYARLRTIGIRGAREAIRWHLVDRRGTFDFSSVDAIAMAAKRHDVQVLWALCHYGCPDDVDLLSSEFVDRFRDYASAAARYLLDRLGSPLLISPFNEISFVAYAVGEKAFMHPFALGQAGEVKRQLVRATIAATQAIREIEPTAVFLHIDPLYHSIPPRGRKDLLPFADANRQAQFEAFDLLTGRIEPELGGRPEFVDAVGLNFYFGNQWEFPSFEPLGWNVRPCDDRWLPLSDLLDWASAHYQRPLFIAETSHFGEGRAAWLRGIVQEVDIALRRGLPIHGICLYPIVDRPDYLDANHWHNSGLWDVAREPDGLRRPLNDEYAAELRRCQDLIHGSAR